MSLLILQSLLAALMFYVLAGQYQRQPLWGLLMVLFSGFVPPLNWAIVLIAVGVRLWKRQEALATDSVR
ncbi:hypothetical protein [Idiomarina xiamenensis]|uniref:Uncharacterized protein n=1 Tax=Idiomarina xiamenensis 10-D-4 TaxID=740709 RepID=K2KFL2_9GAMM|nr:hypothetical protein [Idiomarina xiamenensis]EKE81454.1 hypothetical protein A10D4_10266 [Idiomarina xiamenensis 10-D-4]